MTRPLVSLYLNREYVGYDTSKETAELNLKYAKLKFPDKMRRIIHGDGTELKEYKDKENCFDAVFTCPPYYSLEKYSGEEGDLSHLEEQEYNKRIFIMFKNLYRLIKQSNYKKQLFYPVIITVGSLRRGEYGLLDMDRVFQRLATKNGFVLHDKLITENLTPGVGFAFRRNYCYKFVTKNYETTLIFLKY